MSITSISSASTLALEPLAHARGAQQGAALRNASPEAQRAGVASQFEAILVRQLLGTTMTAMLGGGEGVAGSIYGDMLANTLSQQLSSGPGLGFGRFIEQQLTPHGERVAASAPSTLRSAATAPKP